MIEQLVRNIQVITLIKNVQTKCLSLKIWTYSFGKHHLWIVIIVIVGFVLIIIIAIVIIIVVAGVAATTLERSSVVRIKLK